MNNKKLAAKLSNALRRTEGLSTVEYIIILCLIAIVGIAAWKRFGESVKARINDGNTQVTGLPGTSS